MAQPRRFYRSKDWLYTELYIKKRKPKEIAVFCGVTEVIIYKWITKHQLGFKK